MIMKIEYRIMMDDRDKELAEEAIGEEIERCRNDGDPCFDDVIARLESLSFERVTDDPAVDLVARLVQHNYNDYAATTQRLVESLQSQFDETRARLELVSEGVTRLCGFPWSPSTTALMDALYPDQDEVNGRKEIIAKRRNG